MINKLLIAGVAAFALAQAAHAGIVSDGGFAEGGAAGGYATYDAGQTIGPWTVTGNSVDLIGSYWQQTPGGSYTVDLDGNGVGGITQNLTLSQGMYQVSFYLGGNPDGGPATKTLDVSIGGVTMPMSFTNAGQTRGNMGYELETFDFTVVTPTTVTTALSFTSTDPAGNPWGPVIGQVAVSAVPEPGSMALVFAGLGLLGTVARRRTRAR